jgi:hypothetical protein
MVIQVFLVILFCLTKINLLKLQTYKPDSLGRIPQLYHEILEGVVPGVHISRSYKPDRRKMRRNYIYLGEESLQKYANQTNDAVPITS